MGDCAEQYVAYAYISPKLVWAGTNNGRGKDRLPGLAVELLCLDKTFAEMGEREVNERRGVRRRIDRRPRRYCVDSRDNNNFVACRGVFFYY